MLPRREEVSVTDKSDQIVLILGDQLSLALSALEGLDKDRTIILMAEVAEEATYVAHHRKKIAFIFSAMRHFAEELRSHGWNVEYVRLDDADNSGSLEGEVARLRERIGDVPLRVTEAGEWRLADAMRSWDNITIVDDDRYLISRDAFREWAEDRSSLRMEYFYRMMRKKTGYLMDGDEPAGGQWNFDKENRKPPKDDLSISAPRAFEPDALTRETIELVETCFSENFGDIDPFWFAVRREDAEAALADFIEHRLSKFGDYQDAMLADEKFLFHAVVSPYLNCGLLDPRQVCDAVEDAYRAGKVEINAAEGFIRQVIGWREYVRGIYWLRMPDYAEENSLKATRPLPSFYWTGDTDMACLAACIRETREEAYAHHIQRLMVTGNFALLAGVDPVEVHRWYLAVYADAYEWVELPNTLGMSQYADGGLLASKPYAASGSYINRMSDYCGDCRYAVSKRTGDNACPFNFLYWDFVARHKKRLESNRRMSPIMHNWSRFSAEEQDRIRNEASDFLAALDSDAKS